MRQILAVRPGIAPVLSTSMRGLWGVCAAVAITCILARLPFLVSPGLSVDSYINFDGWPEKERFLSQGRFGQFLLLRSMRGMGVDPETFATLFQGVGLACFAFVAPLFFASFDRPGQTRAFAIVVPALLLVLHPFQAEILTFSEASFTAQIAISTGIAAVFITARAPRLWWLGAALMVAALSTYQLVLNYVGIMILVGFTRACIDAEGDGAARWRVYRPSVASAIMVALSVVMYFIANALFISVLDLDMDQRGQLMPMGQWGARVDEVLALGRWLYDYPLLVPTAPVVGAAFWSLAIGGWLVACWLLVRRWKRETPIALLLVLSGPLLGLGVVLAGSTWWPAPRVLGGVVAICAAGSFWLCLHAESGATRVGVVVVAGLVLVSSIAIGHRIHSDQVRLNAYDAFLAGQIMTSLRGVDGFNEQMPIAVVNTKMRWTHGVALATTWKDMNISVFHVPDAVPARMTLTTGRKLNFRRASDEDVAACAKAPAWPEAGFVSRQADGSALVCL